MKTNKRALGFSVIDIILLLLVAVCILTAVFRTQLHHFLGREEQVQVEYTFLVRNASEDAKNYPKEGEEIYLSDSSQPLGVIGQITRTEKKYQEVEDPEDTLKVVSLTCQASVKAYSGETGYSVGNTKIKPGAQLSVYTDSASFTMTVTMVKAYEE